MQPHHIDHFSVYRGMVAVEGWAKAGTPAVLYRGRPVLLQSHQVHRPDLPQHHGEEADGWGFGLRALVGHSDIQHEDLSLLFPDGTRLDHPGLAFAPTNDALDRLLGRFKRSTEAGGRVLEIGSRARSGNTYHQFISPNAEYVGLDITDGPNVHVVGDAHHISRHAPGPFDFVFSISVFEHLLMPWKTALEMNKVMRPGALAYIQSHPAWPLHEEPWDFWRFSENAWEGLFNAHTGFRMLDRAYALPAKIVPTFATGGHMQAHEHARTFMVSACLVEKVGAPLVSWEAEAGDLYNLAYSHA